MFYILLDFKQFRFVPVVHVQTMNNSQKTSLEYKHDPKIG